jgi:mannose-6-phosphate isomerase-like protein (cupin superfamily)
MMKRCLLVFTMFVPLLVEHPVLSWAQLPQPANGGITVWRKGVPPQGITHKDDFGDHMLQISHRDADGKVEVHQTKADVIVIQSGEADFVSGGEIQNPVVTLPNELQGTSIKGGVRIHVEAGDILNVPTGVPHQFFLTPGTQITYFVVKVVGPRHVQSASH